MSVPTTCLDDDRLLRLGSGQLTAEEQAQIQAHLAACPACAARLQTLQPARPDISSTECPDLVTEIRLDALPPLAATSPALPTTRTPRPSSETPTHIGRYAILGVIGRGGMGIVYRGHDASLDRALAIKVVLPEHTDNDSLKLRFLKEARIMGQLQHPGVAPVHEIGELPDGRPFFSMKQIEGHTFAELLHRANSENDLSTHIGVFAQICQTLAYAHSRRIIHRDLKPENVMVGAFGEVQVMDWGLAKVMGSEKPQAHGSHPVGLPARKEVVDFDPHATLLRRYAGFDTPPGDATLPGRVMGTLAYMAPEQARGETEYVDQRSDVFGLGAILCEILTGKPPYLAAGTMERHMQAARPDLTDALTRLRTCAADAELIELARRCLEADPDRRPQSAGAVAEAVARYRAEVQDRLRQAEIARAAAQVKAAEEGKRRRVSVAFLVAVLALVVAVSAAALWYVQDQAERAEQAARLLGAQAARTNYVNSNAEAALDDAQRPLAEIEQHLADPLKTAVLLSNPEQEWDARLALSKKALDYAAALAGSDSDGLTTKVQTRLADLGKKLRAAREDWALAMELDAIRLKASELTDGKFDPRKAASHYETLFARRLKMVFAEGNAGQRAGQVTASRIRYVLVAALDHWAEVLPPNSPELPAVLETARLADADPWRDQVRNLRTLQNPTYLEQLAGQADPARHSPQLALLLASFLTTEAEVRFLKQAALSHPRDFWIHFALGTRIEDRAVALGHFLTALAIRPGSSAVYGNIGVCLHDLKDEAGAVAAFHKALRHDPNNAIVQCNLGTLLHRKGQLDEALDAYRKAIQIDPQLAAAHFNLGLLLLTGKHDPDGAIDAFRKATAADPGLSRAHYQLGQALYDKKDLDGAIDAFQKASDTDAKNDLAHHKLGLALHEKKDLDGAIDAYRKAIAASPKSAPPYNDLGNALREKGNLDGAIDAYHKALERDPKYALAHYNLGFVLGIKEDLTGAAAAFRQAIACDGQLTPAYVGLGLVLRQVGSLQESVQLLTDAAKRFPKDGAIQKQLQASRRLLELDQRLADVAADKVRPASAAERIEYAEFCLRPFKKEYALALKLYRDAFAAERNLEAAHRYNAACAALLLAARKDAKTPVKGQEAADLRRQALQWLQADLEVARKDARSDKVEVRKEVQELLAHWKADADLASVRDAAALKELPAAERQAWQRFWADVDQLLAILSAPPK